MLPFHITNNCNKLNLLFLRCSFAEIANTAFNFVKNDHSIVLLRRCIILYSLLKATPLIVACCLSFLTFAPELERRCQRQERQVTMIAVCSSSFLLAEECPVKARGAIDTTWFSSRESPCSSGLRRNPTPGPRLRSRVQGGKLL